MVYLFGLVILLLIFVSIIPVIQVFAHRRYVDEEIEYKFPQELFNSDMDHLRFEQPEGKDIPRISIQNRGSVRLARGNILSTEKLESRKAEAYSAELP